MKYLFIIFGLTAIGLGVTQISTGQETNEMTCDLDFKGMQPCKYKTANLVISAELTMAPSRISKKRKELVSLTINRNNQKHTLKITPHTTLVRSGFGYLSFEDINFDDIPDLAITTSFGTANLYLDYWVYNPNSNTYIKVGNHSVFEFDKKSKTMTSTDRVNAATFDVKRYKWDGFKIIEVKNNK